jgi:hypothetical protein
MKTVAKKKVAQHYEAIYYDGWGTPAYHLLDSVEGESPEQALRDNLPHLTAQVRELFGLSRDDVPDEDIQETLYVIRSDGLVSVHNLERTNW